MFGQQSIMKYGTARGVYFAAAIFLTLWGIGCLLVPTGDNPPSGWHEIIRSIPGNLLMAMFPLGFGVFCWSRYRYWTREAIRRNAKPEQPPA
jgi:uncharacterized membrane protein YbhN (UPF0104 family)